MTKETMWEVVSAAVFAIFAILLLDPRGFWMPSMSQVTMLGFAAAAFGAYIVFVLREKATDERDEAHRSFAGRAVFLAGSVVLFGAIVLQSKGGHVDGWLVGALLAMILAKLSARTW